MTGIYGIRNRTTGTVYIGSSGDLERRWKQHRALLNRGAHPTPRLQAAWLAHGPDVFVFVVLEECAASELKKREQWWLDSIRPHIPDNGYNEMSSTRADWANAEYREHMSAANKRRANTPEGKAQIKAARAARKDYSTFGAHARSFVKKARNQHREWDPEELSYLGEHYGLVPVDSLSRILGHPKTAIYQQADTMGLKSKGTQAFKERMQLVSLDRERKRREARSESA